MSHAEFLAEMRELMETPETLTGSEQLADLEGWNSVAMMGFIALADEKFSKNVSPRSIAQCGTVDDLGKLLGVPAA